MKVALITGLSNFLGTSLAEILIERNYFIYATDICNKKDAPNKFKQFWNKENFWYYVGTSTDASFMTQLIATIKITHFSDRYSNQIDCANPSYKCEELHCFHLEKVMDPSLAKENSEYTHRVNTFGTLNLLNSIKNLEMEKFATICNLVSGSILSEFDFEKVVTEKDIGSALIYNHLAATHFSSKCLCSGYKNSHDMNIYNAIILYQDFCLNFDHDFTKNIQTVYNINDYVEIGDLKDYAEGLYLICTNATKDNGCDYFLSTGKFQTKKSLISEKFEENGIELKWESATAYDGNTLEELIDICKDNSVSLFRTMPNLSCEKAKTKLGWLFP
jgi:GDP-D-mannose dehydratase